MSRSLVQWVDYIQTLHHREIELSLERVRDVYNRMYPNGLPYKIISLSGTNGKGSTAEILASVYREAGYRVGKFTSPHLVRFNERFNLNGRPVSDSLLLDAFDRVENSRQTTPITFFEYGTLLAIDLFASQNVDIAIMEVGLGGRLDSVNILVADVSIVTSISIDHTSWLGNTIEEIAQEKVGIARKDKPLILGLNNPPKSMIARAQEIGARIRQIGKDFSYNESRVDDTWAWQGEGEVLNELPLPFRQTGVQLSNCSLALEAVRTLSQDLPFGNGDIQRGINNASILGRCQVLQQSPYIVLDVSHNETSVARLAQFLDGLNIPSSGRILAVCGMLKDKEIGKSLKQISDHIDVWHTATIHNERGASASDISAIVSQHASVQVFTHDYVQAAYDQALSVLTNDDCLVVFGSFHIVGDILSHINNVDVLM